MSLLTIHGIDLSQKEATEILALAPDVPPVMTDEDVRAAIGVVLTAHGDDLGACIADLAERYGDQPAATAARISRATVFTARLIGAVL